MFPLASGRAAAALLLPPQLIACTGWHLQRATPQDIVAAAPSRIRVTRTDSTRVVLDHPTMLGDTVMGESNGRPAAIPADQVASVAIHEMKAAETLFLFGGVMFLLIGGANSVGSGY